MKAMKIQIKSREKKFGVNINNSYAPRYVAVPGTIRKETEEAPADVMPEQLKFKVLRHAYAVNAEYDEAFYSAQVFPKPGVTFFEAPYSEEENDPNKKLNIHFKELKQGDNVPLEYIIWRFAHQNSYQLQKGYFSLVVTKQNFGVIQWLLQALYNDIQNEFCHMPIGSLHGLFARLEGEKSLVRMPNEVVDATVGKYDIIKSNKGFIQESIEALKKEIADKEALLGQTQEFQNDVKGAGVLKATTAEGTADTTVTDVLAQTIQDSEDIPALITKALDAGKIKKAGAFYKLDEETIGKGKQALYQAVENDPTLKARIKESLLQEAVAA